MTWTLSAPRQRHDVRGDSVLIDNWQVLEPSTHHSQSGLGLQMPRGQWWPARQGLVASFAVTAGTASHEDGAAPSEGRRIQTCNTNGCADCPVALLPPFSQTSASAL